MSPCCISTVKGMTLVFNNLYNPGNFPNYVSIEVKRKFNLTKRSLSPGQILNFRFSNCDDVRWRYNQQRKQFEFSLPYGKCGMTADFRKKDEKKFINFSSSVTIVAEQRIFFSSEDSYKFRK